jgi:hypothetical protein
MSEENKDTSGTGTEKPAAKAPAKKRAARKAPAKPAAAKTAATKTATTARKAAPKKTGAAGTKKAAAPKKAAAAKAPAAKAKVAAAPAAQPEPDEAAQAAASTTASEPEAETTSSTFESTGTSGASDTEDRYSADRIASEFKDKDWGNVVARAAFTLFYFFATWVALVFGSALSVIQFLIYLVSGEGNDVIRRAILSIGKYIGDVAAYFSFTSTERPFPFGKDLPDGE